MSRAFHQGTLLAAAGSGGEAEVRKGAHVGSDRGRDSRTTGPGIAGGRGHRGAALRGRVVKVCVP